MINGVDWIGFVVTFGGAFILGAMSGATITAMIFEQKGEKKDESSQNE